MEDRKPLGKKSYGHIPHLPGSRMGPGDHKCHEGQLRIATEKTRDRHDKVIVQEKLDGSNVGVARVGDRLFFLTRAGYLAITSPYDQHHRFHEWAEKNEARFRELLQDGERLCGEWLFQAHGTRYKLPHEPFVAFDLMRGTDRATLDELTARNKQGFVLPRLISCNGPVTIEAALKAVTTSGHGAIDTVEGAVWRVERNEMINPGKGGERKWKVDFVVKFVRPEKQDGIYLPEVSGNPPVYNEYVLNG